jgi:hypothetical protein
VKRRTENRTSTELSDLVKNYDKFENSNIKVSKLLEFIEDGTPKSLKSLSSFWAIEESKQEYDFEGNIIEDINQFQITETLTVPLSLTQRKKINKEIKSSEKDKPRISTKVNPLPKLISHPSKTNKLLEESKR